MLQHTGATTVQLRGDAAPGAGGTQKPAGGSEAQSDFGPECAVYVSGSAGNVSEKGKVPGSHETSVGTESSAEGGCQSGLGTGSLGCGRALDVVLDHGSVVEH